MPDVLLIQPPIRDFYLTAKRTLPYGLAAIAASLRTAGFTVDICDGLATSKSRIVPWPRQMAYLSPFYGRPDRSPFGLFHHFRHFGYSLEHIARQAKTSGAWLIGISSLFSAYSDVALETAAAVKKACPTVPIVMGGHHPTALPQEVVRHPAVDYVLRGDGEVGLPALARALRLKTSLDKVQGLVLKSCDAAAGCPPPAVALDLDLLPTPALDLIAWKHYQRAGRGSLALTASRGCPMRCTYCAVNATSYHGFRQRTVASVTAELEQAFNLHPMGFIDFEDEHLCADRAWAMSLMEQMTRRFSNRRLELRAMNGLYAPNMDNDLLNSMKRAGFRNLNLALISTAAAQLKRFGRPDITAEVDRVIHRAGQLGMNCVAYLIVGGPSQDPHQSVDDLVHLAQRRVLAGVSVFYPAPGSGDYRWCRRHDLLPSDPMLMRSSALPLVHTTDRRQNVTLLRLGRILNFIKSLLDSRRPLPPAATPPSIIETEMDRHSTGELLLAAFLEDGVIRGVDEHGMIYPHVTDLSLTKRFIEGVGKIKMNGSV